MDSQTTSPAAADALAAMLQHATVDDAKGNESSNPAHDMFKFVLNNNNIKKECEHLAHVSSNSVPVPCELVERILLFLDPISMLTCRLVSREFNDIIQSSTLLQYVLACKAAGIIDNPQSPLSYAERLEAIQKREDAWRKLKPVFEMTLSINPQTASQICRTTEGVCFLSDDNLKNLNCCHLTSSFQDNPRWTKIPGHGPALNWSGIVIGFVAALYEHDLVVNLIFSDIENQADMQQHSLDLVLLKFSTGEYHPLARRPRIHVQGSLSVKPWVASRIVGNNIALVVNCGGTSSDKLLIFDWKTGRKLLQHEATGNAYSGLVFVSPELLLVPNRLLSHFEVWHLPSQKLDPKPPVQILSLRIPAVSPEYSISDLCCNGEPNPFPHPIPYLPPRTFVSSPENAIIIIKLRMSSDSHQSASYDLIMHRRALLDTILAWASQQENRLTWLTNEVHVHRITNPEDGLVELDARSKLVWTMPRTPSPGSSTSSSTSRYTFLQVPWTKWGPPISRWFRLSEPQARWLTACNGQRCAFSELNPLDRRKMMVSVADFNPYGFRRNRASREGEDNDSDGNNKEGKDQGFEILDHKGVFLEEVYMGLKCVVYRAPDEFEFDVVSMDGERLLGVKLNHDGWRESITFLYIG